MKIHHLDKLHYTPIPTQWIVWLDSHPFSKMTFFSCNDKCVSLHHEAWVSSMICMVRDQQLCEYISDQQGHTSFELSPQRWSKPLPITTHRRLEKRDLDSTFSLFVSLQNSQQTPQDDLGVMRHNRTSSLESVLEMILTFCVVSILHYIFDTCLCCWWWWWRCTLLFQVISSKRPITKWLLKSFHSF